MIGKLFGKVDLIRNNYAIIDVAGVGYKVQMTEITLGTLSKQDEAEVFIHTHVREDQLALFGFLSLGDLEMFELLISISGIGPKAALGILAIASPKAISTAVINEDSSILTRVSGVGKKTAERVILELQNKVEKISEVDRKEACDDQEIIEALMAMGYNISEAREAVREVSKEKTANISEKIKLALKSIKK